MKEIIDNQILASLIVFLSQIGFIYFRTLNVIYTVERNVIAAVLTGVCIGVLTLLSFSIGIESLKDGNYWTVAVFLIGGAIGTYWGIKQSIKKEDKKIKK
jgi:uncharacterized membrane protein YfcA